MKVLSTGCTACNAIPEQHKESINAVIDSTDCMFYGNIITVQTVVHFFYLKGTAKEMYSPVQDYN